ncbi:CPK9 [Symbiodinium natans]|uniref:non-specific serine/threonine protein kinase n=1 Tax=Symbiodinium natans TaxID=878477 RepID=A0A812Q693_9DINO|nr:CPK9 [Symbiodinium natans]
MCAIACFSAEHEARHLEGLRAMATQSFVKGEVVEVWSNSQKSWISGAVVLEAPDRDCVIDGYAIPAGAVKVTSSAGTKWILPDQVPSALRKVQGGDIPASEPALPPLPGAKAEARPSAKPGMCKMGCNRPVQPGLTRGMKAFDTCCKKCAQGKGGHDANCGGSSAKPLARSVTTEVEDPQHWLLDLLSSADGFNKYAGKIVATVSGDAGTLNASQAQEAVSKYLLQPIGTSLPVDMRAAEDWISKFGTDGVMDTPAFTKLVHQILQDRVRTWFPEKLIAKTHSFVRQNPARVETVYEVGKLLGEGSFGKVYNVQHRISGESRVCKKIAKLKGKEGMKVEEILQEIESMATLDHPNVIKVYEYFQDRDSVSQIMEPCYGGELQDRINDVYQKGKPSYSEDFVCDVMKQTLRALAFMHSHNFMHKDLKPQNIMLVSKESASIKVIDFGLAELFEPDQKHSDAFGGTLLYMAPEVFKLKLEFKSDIWSAGVIHYNLMTGDYPFMATWPLPKGKTMEWWQTELARSICEDNFRDNKRLKNWSTECNDLLRQMLEKSVSKRPDAAACLEHSWFKKYEATPPPLSIGITQCLEAYAGQPELKKSIFLLIAHMCTAPALSELRAIFTHFDTLNQGCLVAADFRDVLYKSGMSSLQVERIVHALDQDRSGAVTWTEFVAGALCVSVCGNKRLVEAAFAVFDKDNDGKVSQADFEDMFAKGDVESLWRKNLPRELQLIGEAGADGKYLKEQFVQYMGRRMQVTSGEPALRERIAASGGWQVTKQLGRGQYGTAYLVAWDEEKCGEESPALKDAMSNISAAVAKVVGLEFLPEKEHNFAFQEVELMRALRHPHIVALRDHFLTEASLELVIVMEFCDSGDLRGEVKRRTQVKPPDLLPEATIMTWFVQMTLALNYMHQRHILHRDLKSSNVFLTTAPSGDGDYDAGISDG